MRQKGSAALLALFFWPPLASAAPPAAAAVTVAAMPEARFVEHRIIPGERISEIAERYGVSAAEILKWNDLDAKRPILRVGHALCIKSSSGARPRKRISYVLRNGDSWTKVAKRFGVVKDHLRHRWNPKVQALQAGQRVTVWIDAPEPSEAPTTHDVQAHTADEKPVQPAPPLATVAEGGMSVGSAARGRLLYGVPIPRNDAIYTIRNPEHSWGSSHAVAVLQRGLADFRRRSRFDREIVIMDMSRERGGRFRPHHSHTSGRDVDIRLPLAHGVPSGTIPRLTSQVDWDAAWSLIEAFVATGELKYVFLSRSRQPALHQAARRAGRSAPDLETLIQFPRRARTALVRHSTGHVKHLHLRFKCASHETECRDL